jgi:hypothetical protein
MPLRLSLPPIEVSTDTHLVAARLSQYAALSSLHAFTRAEHPDSLRVRCPRLLWHVRGSIQESLVEPRNSPESGPGGIDVTAISLWDNKAAAETYNTNTYPEVLKTMARFMEGTPKVQTGEAVNSTFHKVAAGVSA